MAEEAAVYSSIALRGVVPADSVYVLSLEMLCKVLDPEDMANRIEYLH
jgi:hypothetical protein